MWYYDAQKSPVGGSSSNLLEQMVSMHFRPVTATSSRSLLVIAGDCEGGLKEETRRAVGLATAAAEAGRQVLIKGSNMRAAKACLPDWHAKEGARGRARSRTPCSRLRSHYR